MPEALSSPEEIQSAFVESDRRAILNIVKVGCFLGIVLMPLGTILDYFVYEVDVPYFLKPCPLIAFLALSLHPST
jgi:hypothetical protein